MGLDDQYHDEDTDGDGEEESVDEQGHEADIMADNLSWPHEDGLSELIGISGFACDEEVCCPTESQIDGMFQGYGLTAFAAGDAIGACNFDVMGQALQDLQDQMHNMVLSHMPMAKKIELHDLIQSKIDQLEQAILDCGDPEETITGFGLDYGLGLDDFGLGGFELSSDSTEFCTYGGGNETTPIDPPSIIFDDPDEPCTTTPEDTPGSTPGTTTPPEDTPGSTPGTTPDDTPDIFQDGFESGDITRWSYGGFSVPTETPTETPDQTTTETPAETPTETPEETPEITVPEITYHIKAKDSVLQLDGTKLSQDLGGQRIKLIDPSLTNPLLAMGDENKIDDGFEAGPNQCTTNATGDCDIKISLADLIKDEDFVIPSDVGDGLTSTPAQGGTPTEVDIEVTGNKINSQNMIVPNSELGSVPQQAIDDADSQLTIGNNTYLTYNSGFSLGVGYKYGDDLKLGLDLNYEFEENICGDEQPGPPIGTFIDTLGLAVGNDIPNAQISIPAGGFQ